MTKFVIEPQIPVPLPGPDSTKFDLHLTNLNIMKIYDDNAAEYNFRIKAESKNVSTVVQTQDFLLKILCDDVIELVP